MALQTCEWDIGRGHRELCLHGTLEFPCAGYDSVYTERDGSYIPWHWHEEMEMILVVSGALRLRTPTESVLLTEGSLVALNANVLHYGEAAGECRIHSLVFSVKLLTGDDETAFAKNYIRPLNACGRFSCKLWRAGESPELSGGFEEAFGALAHDRFGYEFTVREKLSRICLSLYREFEPRPDEREEGRDRDGARLRVMLEYIQTHYAERLSLSDVAGQAGIGERECLRCFQKTIQISPMQYLLKYRVARGAQLLADEPSASVSEIALACGFDSPSHFSQQFRRFFRCAPREYRRSVKKEVDFAAPVC